MPFENKVNDLTGKEWLKHSINFWTLEDLKIDTIYNEFRKYCCKDNKVYSFNDSVDNNDFSFSVIDCEIDIMRFFSSLKKGTYNSYHVALLDNEIVDNVNLASTITSNAKLCGAEYRGKIIISTNKYDEYKIALLFLNRGINSIDRIDVDYIDANCYEKGYILESKSKIDQIGLKHPAPYSYVDINRICQKEKISNKMILDPFLGIGSTIIGTYENNSNIGIELNPEYVKLITERFKFLGIPDTIFLKNKIINGDSMVKVDEIDEIIDVVMTSPPYFTILKNKTSGVRTDESQSRQGIEYYSDNENDIGNVENYSDYISAMKSLFAKIRNHMNDAGYVYIVVSDFTVNKKEMDVHSDYIHFMNDAGFKYCSTSYLLQNQKAIYPFGYPFKLVLNHIFQYVMKFKVN